MENFWISIGVAVTIGFFTAAVWSFTERLIEILRSIGP